MTTSLLASVKRKKERRSLFKVGLSPFRSFKRRSNQSSSSKQKRARVVDTMKHNNGAGKTSSRAAVSEENKTSSTDALARGTVEAVERVVVDNFTMQAMRIEVMDLLATNRSCSVCSLAAALAQSDSVMTHHGNNNDATKGLAGEDADDSILQGLTTLTLNDAATTPLDQRQALRRKQLRNALHALEVRVGSSSQQITSWIEAREVLSDVVQFPDVEVKPKPQPALGSEVDKYYKRIQEALRTRLGRRQKPTSIKWQQVAKTSLPYSSQDQLSSNYASTLGTATAELDLVDDAQRGQRKTAMEMADFSLDQRVGKAYEDREKRRRGEELEEVEEHFLEEEREAEALERASSLLRPLTDKEQEIVQNAMYSIGSEDEVISQVGTDSVQRVSMHRLQPGQWLNDEVIHYFYIMLSKRDEEMCRMDTHRKRSHFFKSFFMTKLLDEGNADPALAGQYNYNLVKRWSKKAPGKDLFALDKIFFPINVGGVHWICAVAYMTKQKLQIYDSMGSGGMEYLQSIFQYLQDEHKAKKGSPLPDADQWELVPCTSDTPRQQNGFDCGVFTCMFADFLSKDCPLTFSQEHVTQCRERIALSIMNGSAIM